MQLLVVRHGAVLYQRPGATFNGDPPLTGLGRRQAEAVADRLSGLGVTHLYSSPALRCLETAQPIAEATGLRGRTVPWLSEWGHVWVYGGPPADQMAERFPDLEPLEPPAEADWGGARQESGDASTDRLALRTRAAAVRERLLRDHPRASADRVCLCTHFGFGGYALLPSLLGTEDPAPGIRGGFDLDHASLTVVECDGEYNSVVRTNCTRHLTGLVAAVCANPACAHTTDTRWDEPACRRCGGTMRTKCPACKAPIPAPVPATCPECGSRYHP